MYKLSKFLHNSFLRQSDVSHQPTFLAGDSAAFTKVATLFHVVFSALCLSSVPHVKVRVKKHKALYIFSSFFTGTFTGFFYCQQISSVEIETGA